MTPSLLILDNAPPGTQTSEELVIENSASRFTIALSRDAWPDTGEEVVRAGLEISYDDGGNWQYLAAFGAMGGDTGSPESTFSSELPDSPPPPLSPEHDPPPPPEPPLRRIRATVRNLVTLSTTVTFGLE